MRLLLVSHSRKDPDGGASRVYHLIEDGLRARGHEVKALHYGDLGVSPLFERIVNRVLMPQAVSRRVGRESIADYDVIMSSSGMLYPYFRRLHGQRQRPLLVNHLHGLAYFDHQTTMMEVERGHMGVSRIYRNVTGPLPVYYDEMGSRNADLTIVQNGRDYDFVTEKCWGPVDTIPLPLHPELLTASSSARLPINRDPGRLLWFGSWVERKGRHYLPAAFEQIAARHPEAILTIGGTGLSAEAIRSSFSPDLRERVQVLPRVSRAEQIQVFGEHSIFLFPSLSEGFGFALLEAMSLGLAAVTTQTGLTGDYLEDRRHAMIVPPSSALHLARAVSLLIEDSELRLRVAVEGQAMARTFTVERTVSAYERAFLKWNEVRRG
jgi:glycosyltransferase involved in cell wall biosynthesis